jgi:hypothetical protein
MDIPRRMAATLALILPICTDDRQVDSGVGVPDVASLWHPSLPTLFADLFHLVKTQRTCTGIAT